MTQFIFVDEIDQPSLSSRKNAGPKARRDLKTIIEKRCDKTIYVDFSEDIIPDSFFGKVKRHIKNARRWKTALKETQEAVCFFNYPFIYASPFDFIWFRQAARRGTKMCLFVHDLLSLRFSTEGYGKIYLWYSKTKEALVLKKASCVVLHNNKMIETALQFYGLDSSKITSIELFDYITFEDIDVSKIDQKKPIVVAGNLSKEKAGYLYQLPSNVEWNLYGNGLAEESLPSTIHAMGAFDPDILPGKLEGSFGLVWDGPSADTCKGDYGNYLKINNPHKVSLYVAAGLPVIVWNQAALAQLVSNAGIGITVSNLKELREILSNFTEDEYSEIRENTIKLAQEIRSGNHTNQAFEKACSLMNV